nr:MAG TPA: hypothetical protein [Caudoviricetes sp.]
MRRSRLYSCLKTHSTISRSVTCTNCNCSAGSHFHTCGGVRLGSSCYCYGFIRITWVTILYGKVNATSTFTIIHYISAPRLWAIASIGLRQAISVRDTIGL